MYLLGCGGVGRALARQIIAARTLHASRNVLRINIIGIADSVGVYLTPEGLTDLELSQLIERKSATGRISTVANYPLRARRHWA